MAENGTIFCLELADFAGARVRNRLPARARSRPDPQFRLAGSPTGAEFTTARVMTWTRPGAMHSCEIRRLTNKEILKGASVGRSQRVQRAEPYLPVIRAGSSAFPGIFAAADNNRASVFQEEEDALKRLRQKSARSPAHTGCCSAAVPRCDSQDAVTTSLL